MRRFSIHDHLYISQCLSAAILLTLSFDQNRKLLIYVGFGSVFALEKSKIITFYKRSAYCHWLGTFSTFDPDVSICIVSKSLSLVMTLKMVNAFYLSI